jgi:hypothetical protein
MTYYTTRNADPLTGETMADLMPADPSPNHQISSLTEVRAGHDRVLADSPTQTTTRTCTARAWTRSRFAVG